MLSYRLDGEKRRDITNKNEETAVVTVNYLLETEAGFSSDECVDAIKSAPLKKAVLSYRKAATSREKANWDVAKACADMKPDLTNEFGSDSTLAAFLGLPNKGAFNKLRRVGAYAKECKEHSIPVTTAMELLPLERIEFSPLNAIMSGDIDGLTKMEVREYVRDYINALPAEPLSEEEMNTESDSETIYADTDSVKNEEEPAEISWLPLIQIDSRVYERLSTAKLNRLRRLTESFCLSAKDALCIDGKVDDAFYTI